MATDKDEREKYNRIAYKLMCYSVENPCYKTYNEFITDFNSEPELSDFLNKELIRTMIREDSNTKFLDKGEKDDLTTMYYKDFFKDPNHKKYSSMSILFEIVKTKPKLEEEHLKNLFRENIDFSISYSRRLTNYNKQIYMDFLDTYLGLFSDLIRPISEEQKTYTNIFHQKLNITPETIQNLHNFVTTSETPSATYNKYPINTFISSMLSFSIFISELIEKNINLDFDTLSDMYDSDSDVDVDIDVNTNSKVNNILNYIRHNMNFKNNSIYYVIMKDLLNYTVPIELNNKDILTKLKRFEDVKTDTLLESDIQYYTLLIVTLWVTELKQYLPNVLKFFQLYNFNKEPQPAIQHKIELYTKGPIPSLPPLHTAMIVLTDKQTLQTTIRQYSMDLNIPDKIYGLTPIAYAIIFQNIEAIQLLTETSAMMDKQGTIGKARILYTCSDCIDIQDLANMTGNTEIIQLIHKKLETRKRWTDRSITESAMTNYITDYNNKKPEDKISSTITDYINPNNIYYHQTSEEVAKIIQATPKNQYWFLAGSSGMFGSGIYFAKTSTETESKALSTGTIIGSTVLLGNPYIIGTREEWSEFFKKYLYFDSDIIHALLQLDGYDSVITIPGPDKYMKTGNEYIVYNTEQVIDPRSLKKGGTNQRLNKTNLEYELQKKQLYIPPWLEHIHDVSQVNMELDIWKKVWLYDQTPLMVACARGHLKSVKLLLHNKPFMINHFDLYGRNAMFYAIHGGNPYIVKCLLDANIDLTQKDTKGKYAIEYFSYKHYLGDNRIRYRTVLLNALLKSNLVEEVNKFYDKTLRVRKEKSAQHSRLSVRSSQPRQQSARMSVKIVGFNKNLLNNK